MALTGWNHSYHLGHSHFLFAKFQMVCIVSECFETVYLIQMNKILESLNTRLLQKWNKGEAESVTLITILFPHCRSIKEGLRIECAPFPSRELLPWSRGKLEKACWMSVNFSSMMNKKPEDGPAHDCVSYFFWKCLFQSWSCTLEKVISHQNSVTKIVILHVEVNFLQLLHSSDELSSIQQLLMHLLSTMVIKS